MMRVVVQILARSGCVCDKQGAEKKEASVRRPGPAARVVQQNRDEDQVGSSAPRLILLISIHTLHQKLMMSDLYSFHHPSQLLLMIHHLAIAR
jgi:hypothetical protein